MQSLRTFYRKHQRRLQFGIVASFILLVFLGLLALAFAFYSYRRPLPQTEGALLLEGLRERVIIHRDEWGVPHIYASNSHDLFLAQGYVHAQDRWWQMEMNRHIGKGEISRIVGLNERVQATDHFIRALGWEQLTRESLRSADPPTRNSLRAYAEGVNGYIGGRSQADLAVEYTVLGLTGRGFEINEWMPLDSLVWLTAFSWQVNGSMSAELEYARLASYLEPNMLSAYFSGSGALFVPPVLPMQPATESLSPPPAPDLDYSALNTTLIGDFDPDNLAFLERGIMPRGSAWVADGRFTVSGAPLLATEMQFGLSIPSLWYEVGLHCLEITPDCPYNMVGMSLAGLPGLVVGHNEQIAWALNNAGVDVKDLYVLRLNPENPAQYETAEGWREMQRQSESIEINDAEPLEVVLYQTDYGAVLTDPYAENNAYALALSWPEPNPADFMSSLLGINRAVDWRSFQAALAHWGGPAMYLLYADTNGNIGMQMVGALPIRNNQHSGLQPAPSWDADYAWRGFLAYEQLPSSYNPERGWIVAANQAAVRADYEAEISLVLGDVGLHYGLSQTWDDGYRARRIADLLLSASPHNVATFASLQADTLNPLAEVLMPYIVALDFSAEGDEALYSYQQWLRDWDFFNDRESAYPVLFSLIWSELVSILFDDQLGFTSSGGLIQRGALRGLLREQDSRWWDNLSTMEALESRDETLRQAFEAAVSQAEAQFGNLKNRWRWGDLHTLYFQNQPLDEIGIVNLEDWFNRGPFGVGGAFSAVYATGWHSSDQAPYRIQTAPAFRMIIDLNDLNNNRSILATGQSGHPASTHYDDMIPLANSVTFRDMKWEQNAIRDNSKSTLQLQPAN